MKSCTCLPLRRITGRDAWGSGLAQGGLVPLITGEMGVLKRWGTATHLGTWQMRLILNSLFVTGQRSEEGKG